MKQTPLTPQEIIKIKIALANFKSSLLKNPPPPNPISELNKFYFWSFLKSFYRFFIN